MTPIDADDGSDADDGGDGLQSSGRLIGEQENFLPSQWAKPCYRGRIVSDGWVSADQEPRKTAKILGRWDSEASLPVK